MSRPAPGPCVHCTKQYETLTWDHVFPKSWYPTTTPQNLEKWKIPAWLKCNHEYGQLEDDLLTAFALCLDPDHPDTADIVARGLRAMDPRSGRDGKDKKKRAARRARVLTQLIDRENVPWESVVPNFGPGRLDDGMTGAVRIRAEYLRRLSEKIVRGIAYLQDRIVISPPYHVRFSLLQDNDGAHIVELAKKFGVIHSREPGIEVLRAVTPEDGISSINVITIWKRLKMYALVETTVA
jgi:hypothetical protein